MKPIDKLVKRIRSELDYKIPDDYYLERTRAGRHQKSSGAWTSVLRIKSNPIWELGFYRAIVDLVKCPKLDIGDSYGLYIECGCIGVCKGLIKND